jgi:hypothetical protein
MEWRDALRDLLKRDISRFHQGIKMFESGRLTMSDSSQGGAVDRTIDTLGWYRSTLSTLERTLTLLESEKRGSAKSSQ